MVNIKITKFVGMQNGKRNVYFDNGNIIKVPNTLNIMVDEDYTLEFSKCIFDYNEEIVTIFNLYCDKANYELIINNSTQFEDSKNKLSKLISVDLDILNGREW